MRLNVPPATPLYNFIYSTAFPLLSTAVAHVLVLSLRYDPTMCLEVSSLPCTTTMQ